MKRGWPALGMLLALLCVLPAHASVRAFLDRDTARMGETITLNVEVDGAGTLAPDFSPLKKDFDVTSRSSNRSVQMENGTVTSKTLWAVALSPRHAGALTIPALDVGGEKTRPLTLQVLPAPAGALGQPGDDVFLEATIAPQSAYVGQQVLYTLKLFYARSLSQGDLDEPHADGVEVHKLGDDVHYQATRGGREYRVIERRYALIPQQPGKLTLPAMRFRGETLDPRNPGGFAGSFFGSGSRVSARSDALSLAVKPEPAGAGKGPWLPAQTLSLKMQGLSAGTTLKVGEPLTLTLSLHAKGLPFEALPEPTLPQIDGAEVYPDKTRNATRDDGQWLYGSRERKFALVPQRPGSLAIPAIAVHWWNVADDRAEDATIAARTLQVMPNAGRSGAATPAMPAPAASAGSSSPVPVPATAASGAPDGTTARAEPWRILALASLVLWLLLVAALAAYLWRRSGALRHDGEKTRPTGEKGEGSRRTFMRCARGGDAQATERALLAWARGERAEIRNLEDLMAQLQGEDQRSAIQHLRSARFSGAGNAFDGGACAGAFARGFAWRDDTADGADDDDGLPPLYPFRVK